VNAMLFRAEGPRVAVIGPGGKVQLRPINIGRDYGATLEILGGVFPTDQVVINPADSLEDGQQVNVAQPPSGPNPPDQKPDQINDQQKGSGS
jgi:multidrug efflux system membrane fusion protein